MMVLLLTVMNYRLWGNAVHEITSVLLFALFLLHNLWNKRWYSTLGRGRQTLRRLLNDGINLLLLIAMLVVLVSGVLISQTVFTSFGVRVSLIVHEIHILAGYLSFLFMAVHLGLHWEMLTMRARRWMGIEAASSLTYRLVSRGAAILIMGYGIHASFSRDIGSKLLMEHTFENWGSTPSLLEFTLDYLAIMGLYIGIAHYLLCYFKQIPPSFSLGNKRKKAVSVRSS